ncbi:hypothetical protein [Actinomadura atramentaria]|uniref:hypothetical protein n=1 Tax=Actinomadura atramentaria TaxID=1990 RepID=UPI000372C3E0|nr:hypothetical protein [Actinomadura atramentaria]
MSRATATDTGRATARVQHAAERADERAEAHARGEDRGEDKARAGPAAGDRESRPSDLDTARRVADAARSVAGVADLTAGPHGRIVTFRVGPPLPGVAVRADAVEIGVVARPDRPLPRLAADVRAAARPHAGGRRVDVLVADVLVADVRVEDARVEHSEEGR